MPSGVYNSFKSAIAKKQIDLVNDTIKVALLTNAASFVAENDTFSDVSAHEVSGTGYTAGGATLGSKTVTTDDTGDRGVFDAANVVWPSATITARYAVIYDTSVSNTLICLIDFGSDISSTNADFTIGWDSDGILEVT